MMGKKGAIGVIVGIIIALAVLILLFKLGELIAEEGDKLTDVESFALNLKNVASFKVGGQTIFRVKGGRWQLNLKDETEEEANELIADAIMDCIHVTDKGTASWTDETWFKDTTRTAFCGICYYINFGDGKLKKEYNPNSFIEYLEYNSPPGSGLSYAENIHTLNKKVSEGNFGVLLTNKGLILKEAYNELINAQSNPELYDKFFSGFSIVSGQSYTIYFIRHGNDYFAELSRSLTGTTRKFGPVLSWVILKPSKIALSECDELVN